MYNNIIATYAAYAKDKSLRMTSSSGAIFPVLARQILSKDGVVYGVALSFDCRMAEFIRVDNLFNLSRLCGSKYLQAKVGNIYQQVKKDLEIGIKVLFSGVTCQINGLKSFLKKDYENLFCVDVVCHGVPSPVLWRKYVEQAEKQNKSRLISVNFRCKDKSWMNSGVKKLYENKNELYISKDKDSFMLMFLRNYCLRPSCYKCVAKNVKMSDLTIADFWGIEDIAPKMNDDKGISLVIIRTNKGTRLFNSIKNKLEYKEVSYEEGVRNNSAEYKSVIRPKERDIFFYDMNKFEFDILQKKYAVPTTGLFRGIIKQKIKKYFL
ncbi:MAG: Coenzyme F420 hydrogenase/dehydrogenase, beta subunit C-terminal domain [Lachnospiraceae bacterium]|nr:Coenzyme F420 hydrogenase/dehydrogenase, beta subunit C-terminal domain [Lachnospiraceae bacterium]